VSEVKFVRLIVDGSTMGNPGKGGWACILKHKMRERVLTGSEPQTTNNKMELVAALRGLQALKEACEIEVVTDSEYLQRGMTQFLAKWKANGWQSSSGKPVLNRELWIELEGAARRHQVRWTWVPGHGAKEPDHNRADSLARQAAMAGTA
jgi:ribonuclease HI